MSSSSCGHSPLVSSPGCCAHLLGRGDGWVRYFRRLTGVGVEADLVCEECKESSGPADHQLCDECLDLIEGELGDLQGVVGAPGIAECPIPFDDSIVEVDLSGLGGQVLDLCAIEASLTQWLVLLEDGHLVRFDSSSQEFGTIGCIRLISEPTHRPWNHKSLRRRLHVSHTGRYVAVVNDYGRHGVVMDLETDQETLELTGGTYYPETVPFACAFVETEDGTVVVHRTNWNRLDVSDAASGRLLTAREPTSFRDGEKRPDHYLDYFHGRVYASPSGRRLLDDGWVWHPVGIPSVWDFDPWISSNPWESEDGVTRRRLGLRDHYWDHGMCWIDDRRVAIGGLGDDDLAMVEGVVVYDVDTDGSNERTAWPDCAEILRFPGPAGEFFSDRSRLFSSDETGLSLWDLERGNRTGQIQGFEPTRQHTGAGQLAELAGSVLRIWHYDG